MVGCTVAEHCGGIGNAGVLVTGCDSAIVVVAAAAADDGGGQWHDDGEQRHSGWSRDAVIVGTVGIRVGCVRVGVAVADAVSRRATLGNPIPSTDRQCKCIVQSHGVWIAVDQLDSVGVIVGVVVEVGLSVSQSYFDGDDYSVKLDICVTVG